jgi:hypothetical protein
MAHMFKPRADATPPSVATLTRALQALPFDR